MDLTNDTVSLSGSDATSAQDGASVPRYRGDAALHPRLQAIITAGRYYGMELDPTEFRNVEGAEQPSAASLAAWATDSGMWARGIRLRWRHLLRFHDSGPAVLLFNDGSAGLLVGANAAHKVVFIKDPVAPEGEAAVPVDELRLAEVWSGEAVLLRAIAVFRKLTRRSPYVGWSGLCCASAGHCATSASPRSP